MSSLFVLKQVLEPKEHPSIKMFQLVAGPSPLAVLHQSLTLGAHKCTVDQTFGTIYTKSRTFNLLTLFFLSTHKSQ